MIEFSEIHWPTYVEAIHSGHQQPPADIQDVFVGPSDATLLSRAAYIAGLGYLVKSATVFSDNPTHGRPTVQSAATLFCDQTGSVLAQFEGSSLTNIKTAADSVCGAKLLARAGSRTLFVVGAGTVAQHAIAAYSACFSTLSEIRVYCRRDSSFDALRAHIPQLDLVRAPSIEAGCKGADIVCTATTANQPVLQGKWLDAGTHVDLVGAFKSDMREADDEVLRRGRLFVDARASTIDHIGEIQDPLSRGIIQRQDILGDLYDLVAKPIDRRPEDITVFKNGGGAHLDLMVARALLDQVPQ